MSRFQKFFLSSILALTLLDGGVIVYKHLYKWRSIVPVVPVVPPVPPVLTHGNPKYVQVRASHMLAFLDSDGQPEVYCSGTVLGPHAILTAAHCNNDSQDSKAIYIDRSLRAYNLIGSSYDGRDHVIILVDGPAFTDIAPYVVRHPKAGETVFVEGFGEEVYPAVEKIGKITGSYDPSEVDKEQKLFYFNNAVIHGDSGAAVYGLDGAILGVVTWRIPGDIGAGYELNYAPKIIHNAQTFNGKNSF